MWAEDMNTPGPMAAAGNSLYCSNVWQKEKRQEVWKEMDTDYFGAFKGMMTGLDTDEGLNSKRPAFRMWVLSKSTRGS